MRVIVCAVLLSSLVPLAVMSQAQQAPPSPTTGDFIAYRGTLPSGISKPKDTPDRLEARFAIYREQRGGKALWEETQSISIDASGHYSVILGKTLSKGIPAGILSSDNERWIGVTPEGMHEQPRTRLETSAKLSALPSTEASISGGAALAVPVPRQVLPPEKLSENAPFPGTSATSALAPSPEMSSPDVQKQVEPKIVATKNSGGIQGPRPLTNTPPKEVVAKPSSSLPGAPGSAYLFGRAEFPVGFSPSGIAAGDFNGDGKPDLVTANGTVSILLAKPDGTFAPKVDYTTGNSATFVAVGDFNADGKLDLAVADSSYQSPSISILLGNGDGSFGAPKILSLGGSPSAIATGDFNRDGKLDLVVTDSSDTVLILLGNGDGTFRRGSTYLSDQRPPGVAVGDLNGDGKLDLVLPSGQNGTSVFVMLGNGDGTFQAPLSSTVPYGPRVAGIADFNRDGIPDLLVGNAISPSILLGNGDGTFQSPITSSVPFGLASFAIGDFNGDGMLDIAVGSGGPSADISILLGNGDGTFQQQVIYSGSSDELVSLDVNGDGQLDLLGIGYSDFGPAVQVLLGDGDGTFGNQRLYTTGVTPVDLGVMDFNHDGHLDLAIVNQNCPTYPCPPGYVSILLGLGDGTFQAKSDYTVGVIPWPLGIGDFNGDKSPDLAVANHYDSTVSILLANGDGTFQPHVDYSTGLYSIPNSLAVGDFKGNGKLDLALGIGNLDTPPVGFAVLLGKGDGSFGPPTDFSSQTATESYITADFRNNGKLDLVACNFSSNTIAIFLGNGDGTFQPERDYAATISNESIRSGDFNGDGKLDLAVVGFFGSAILLGNGDGTFQSPLSLSSGGFAMTTGDFNGDGKLDLFVPGSVLLGNGDGTFNLWPGPDINIMAAPASADVDGDGNLDIVALSQSLGNAPYVGGVAIYFNLPEIALFPDRLAFAPQVIGTTSDPKALTVSNPTFVPLRITDISASGDFAQSSDCPVSPATLAPGANCTVSVTFTPTGKGKREGTIAFSDNSPGGQQEIKLTGTAASAVGLSTTELNLGIATVGSSSPAGKVGLKNLGIAPISIDGISIIGPHRKDFAESDDCGGSIPPGQACTITIIFTPRDGGARLAAIQISDSDLYSPQIVNLRGLGRLNKPR